MTRKWVTRVETSDAGSRLEVHVSLETPGGPGTHHRDADEVPTGREVTEETVLVVPPVPGWSQRRRTDPTRDGVRTVTVGRIPTLEDPSRERVPAPRE